MIPTCWSGSRTPGSARAAPRTGWCWRELRQAVAALPEDQRAVLGLVAIDGLSYKEAAAALDVPIGTVMSRLARARGKLMRFVGEDAG